MSNSTTTLQGHRGVLLAVLVFTLLSAFLATTSWLRLKNDRSKVVNEANAAAIIAVTETVRLIGHRVESLKIAEKLARELDDGTLNHDNLEARIRHEISGNDDIAITVGWLRGYFPASSRPQDDTEIIFKLGYKLGDQVRVTDGSYAKKEVANQQHGDISAWYSLAVNQQRPVWFGNAYLSPVSHTWWAGGYSVPFFIDGKVAGVVAAELTVAQANQAMFEAEDAGFSKTPIDSNFGILVSKSGTMFSHPNLNVVEERRHISNFIPELTTPADIKKLYPRVSQSADAEIYLLDNYQRERTGQTLSVYFAPIIETDWWVVLVLDQMAIDRDVNNLLRVKSHKFGMYISFLALVFGLSLLILRVNRGQETSMWVAAFIFSILCVAGIAGVLYVSFDQGGHSRSGEVLLQNLAITSKAIMRHQGDEGPVAITVPTGIFIQSAKFSSANDVTITGYIWQKYTDDMPQWLQRDPDKPKPGFIFPEAEQLNVEYRYKRPTSEGWLYGWYFNAVVRQEFDYTKYPFDREVVWLRMWHSEIGRGVILTPDLSAYDTLVQGDFPGLELQDFVLEGWDVTGTYFSYRDNQYNTSFGIDDLERSRNVPELYFNIAMSRAFLNAFIMNFITISVVAFLLFAVLFTIRTDMAKTDLLGFSVSAVLGFCAALFFVVILAHTSLRETLAAQSLVYLEYYFFVMYAAFLGVSVNAIVAASDVTHPILRHGDNLIARLLYWPLLSFSLLVVTLMIF